MKEKLTSKIGNIIFYVIIAILLFSGITAKLHNEIPSFFGYSFMHVVSASMETTIMTNDIAIGKKVSADDEITIGDIYIYENTSGLKIIHRIIKQNENEQFIFKGDNNAVEDYMPVSREQIEFKYLFRLPYLGYLVLVFKNIYFYVIVIAAYAAIEILKLIKRKKTTE